jgi:hypothetical protein
MEPARGIATTRTIAAFDRTENAVRTTIGWPVPLDIWKCLICNTDIENRWLEDPVEVARDHLYYEHGIAPVSRGYNEIYVWENSNGQ